MRPRIHHLILSASLLLLLPSISYAQSLTKITEPDIQVMMEVTDKATRRGNVDALIAYFAPDIKIHMSVLNPGQTKEEEGTLTKDEYAARTRRNMRRKLSYQYERKNTKIKIYDHETAMVTCDVYETIKLPEGTLRAASSSAVYITLRNGKLVITNMDVRMRVY